MIIYAIGGDCLNGVIPALDDYAATFGYCSAEFFWREFLMEFKKMGRDNGGVAEQGTSERNMIDWNKAKQLKFWDSANQPKWITGK